MQKQQVEASAISKRALRPRLKIAEDSERNPQRPRCCDRCCDRREIIFIGFRRIIRDRLVKQRGDAREGGSSKRMEGTKGGYWNTEVAYRTPGP